MELALNKKAIKPVVLDVSSTSNVWDYLVICSAESSAQVEAICDEVTKESKKFGYYLHHRERDNLSTWVLVDFFDVILHVFMEDARTFYDLEHLWTGAKKVRIPKKK